MTIVPYINNLKKEVFGNENAVLHEIKIRNAKEDPYKVMRHKTRGKPFGKR